MINYDQIPVNPCHPWPKKTSKSVAQNTSVATTIVHRFSMIAKIRVNPCNPWPKKKPKSVATTIVHRFNMIAYD